MKQLFSILIFSALCNCAIAQLTPNEAITRMTRGINLGNTLEPPVEGAWNNGPAQEFYFDDFKTAGFSTVRIPVRWDQHTQTTAPYTVDPAWLDRVEEVVDWGLERDFFVIINSHHDDWLKQNYSSPSARARFDSIWVQIANRFQFKSDSLFFEIFNEPFGMTTAEVDDMNSRILPLIRKTNPTRIVVYSGADYSGAAWLMSAAIPNDDYIMGYYHSYDPWDFSGLGNGTWGSQVEKDNVRNTFEAVANWSAENDIPVMISEFGAIRSTDYNSRMRIYAFYVEQALRNRIAFEVWDDGGNFGLYDRTARSWADEKDILIHTHIDGPTDILTESIGDTLVAVTWQNRTARNDSMLVERRTSQTAWARIATIATTDDSFVDATVEGGNDYYYRVIAKFSNGDTWMSYPSVVTVRPTTRSNFLGSPFILPGLIEAEDYDIGGESLTYHDTDAVNLGGAYRPDEGVDIELRSDGGHHVAYVESGEWMEYTVDVAEAGTYTVTTSVASLDGGGRLGLQFGDGIVRSERVPQTGSWTSFQNISSEFDLTAGEQILRMTIQIARPFNIDHFVITQAGATNTADVPQATRFEIYPNPVTDDLIVSSNISATNARVWIGDLMGRTILDMPITSKIQRIPLNDLPNGVYLLRHMVNGRIATNKTVVKL